MDFQFNVISAFPPVFEYRTGKDRKQECKTKQQKRKKPLRI